MCTWTAFILETNKELDGAYERLLLSARDFQECSSHCMDSLDKHGFLCRSFMFDEVGQICIIYDEDPLSHEEILQTDQVQSTYQQFKIRPLKPSTGSLYRVICVNDEKGIFIIIIIMLLLKFHQNDTLFFPISAKIIGVNKQINL